MSKNIRKNFLKIFYISLPFVLVTIGSGTVILFISAVCAPFRLNFFYYYFSCIKYRFFKLFEKICQFTGIVKKGIIKTGIRKKLK